MIGNLVEELKGNKHLNEYILFQADNIINKLATNTSYYIYYFCIINTIQLILILYVIFTLKFDYTKKL
jgi:hypothetical protein